MTIHLYTWNITKCIYRKLSSIQVNTTAETTAIAPPGDFESFQDLESVLNSFEILDTKNTKVKRRRSLASSIKFWKTKDDST